MIKALGQIFNFSFIWTYYPLIYFALSIQSFLKSLQAIGKSPKVFWENEHDGQPIAVVALYQKGSLRRDTQVLLDALKKKGLYVIGVNTLKLDEPSEANLPFDCYIERFNFGRDFGSYKTGLLHLFSKRWNANCPRLLIVNDSVFCISDRIDAFVDQMVSSDTEVLGSTENFETAHHLGSFCICFSQSVINKNRSFDIGRSIETQTYDPRSLRTAK